MLDGFNKKGRSFAFALLIGAGAASSGAMAQLVPGFREPADQAEAMRDAYSYGCFLAVAGRPMPGVNMPLLGTEGEGLRDEPAPPAWLGSRMGTGNDVRTSAYDAPGGRVWIAYDRASNRCMVATQPRDPASFRAALLDGFPDAPGSWQKDKSGDGFSGRIKGEKLVWHIHYVELDADGAAYVEMTAERR